MSRLMITTAEIIEQLRKSGDWMLRLEICKAAGADSARGAADKIDRLIDQGVVEKRERMKQGHPVIEYRLVQAETAPAVQYEIPRPKTERDLVAWGLKHIRATPERVDEISLAHVRMTAARMKALGDEQAKECLDLADELYQQRQDAQRRQDAREALA